MKETEIAVIGMSGIFPEAKNINEFIDNLCNKKSSIGKVSEKRLKLNGQDCDKNYIEYGYLKNIDFFDYKFFNLTYKEAIDMDPQQRILLQEACKTIWDSGYSLESMRGSETSVIISCNDSGYDTLLTNNDGTSVIGSMRSFAAARIAYHLDLRGEAYVLDTSCSSSLVAVHHACNILKSGQADYVIVGGVNFNIHIATVEEVKMSQLGIASKEARCKTFDDSADGAGGGEGCGVILCKRLQDAIKDNDHIYCIIKSSSTNQDASLSNSIVAPSPIAQTNVILKAWEMSDINPENIKYIEAHGTGTKIGDPIEIKGLTDAFKKYTENTGFCAVSSVKSNIGHTGYSAGILSFIKAVLAVNHKLKFPLANFKIPNKLIPFSESAVYPSKDLEKWTDEIRLAGISSFGLTGTNSHVVIGQYDYSIDENDGISGNKIYPFIVSARDEETLKKYCLMIHDNILHHKYKLKNLSYTLCTGRDRYEYQKVFFADSIKDVKNKLIQTEISSAKKNNRECIFLCSNKSSFTEEEFYQLCSLCEKSKNLEAVYRNASNKNRGCLLTILGQIAVNNLITAFGIDAKVIVGNGVGNITVSYLLGKIDFHQLVDKAIEFDTDNSVLDKQRFTDYVKSNKGALFIELGHIGNLSSIILEDKECDVISLSTDCSDYYRIVENIIKSGVTPLWDNIYNDGSFMKLSIPVYPFKEVSCWVSNPKKYQEEPKKEENQFLGIKDTTEFVRKIWEYALGNDKFNNDDDFFELGGNSLMVMKIINLISEYRNVILDFDNIYEYNTVNLLVNYIERCEKSSALEEIDSKIYRAEKSKELSYYQKSMLILYKQNPKSTAYNMPACIEIKGDVDCKLLFDSMNHILKKHEILRTIYSNSNEFYDPIVTNKYLPLDIIDLSESDNWTEDFEIIKQEMEQVIFDLTQDIPIKMRLVKKKKELSYLFIQLHHICADGWSIGIIMKELSDNYHSLISSKSLNDEPLKAQYSDYAVKNNLYLKSDFGKSKLDFWKSYLSNIPQYLDFPTDKKRPKILKGYGDKINFSISHNTLDKMKMFCNENKISLYTFLLSTYSILLYKYSGQSDFCIGTPVANRKGITEEKIIGFFANTLVVRVNIDEQESVFKYLSNNRKHILKLLNNQEIPFEMIVENLEIERNPSRLPVFQYGFVLQNNNKETRLDGLELKFIDMTQQYSKFEMLLSLSPNGSSYDGILEYCTEIFTEETMVNFINNFKILIEKILENYKEKISEINYFIDDESLSSIQNDSFLENVYDF